MKIFQIGFVFFQSLITSYAAENLEKFVESANFLNIYCSSGHLWTKSVPSLSKCSSHCSADTVCLSVFYLSALDECRGNGDILIQTVGCDALAGSRYYIAGACGMPSSIANAELSASTGTQATYNCVHSASNEQAVSTCGLDGQWTDPDKICVAAGDIGSTCTESIDCSGASHTVCDSGACACETGYGPSAGDCVWLGPDCGTPPSVSDATLDLATMTTAYYTCIYSPTSTTVSLTCQSDNKWSAPDPTCVAFGDLGSTCTQNTDCTGASHSMCNGGSCDCESGYGVSTGECVWLGPDCGNPPSITDASLDGYDMVEAYYTCTYSPNNEQFMLTCEEGDQWSSPHITCIAQGVLGAYCTQSSGCTDSSTACTANECTCGTGYVEDAGSCVASGPVCGDPPVPQPLVPDSIGNCGSGEFKVGSGTLECDGTYWKGTICEPLVCSSYSNNFVFSPGTKYPQVTLTNIISQSMTPEACATSCVDFSGITCLSFHMYFGVCYGESSSAVSLQDTIELTSIFDYYHRLCAD